MVEVLQCNKNFYFFSLSYREDDTVTALAYEDAYDLAQSTSYQIINGNIGSDNDESGIGNNSFI
jgi:hypothetical protein